MRRKSAADKLITKRQAWLERTMAMLDTDEAEVRQLLLTRRRQSLRLNPLQAAGTAASLQALRQLGWEGQQYDWMADGYTITAGQEALRDSQLAADGALLIQNAASWLPVLALQPQPGERILDVCAAPGGKTSHIAALTGNRAQITANDNSRARLAKLQAMCKRLHTDVERYTLYDATQLARKLDEPESYDRILIDAPCSGEGLMRFDRDKDFATWSVAHIKRLQQLQKRIIGQAWQLLKPGGRLVYSTCTMAPEENEAVIDYALRALEGASLLPPQDAGLALAMNGLSNQVPAVLRWNDRDLNPELRHCLRLKPSLDIEAFFVAVLHKTQ